MLSPWISRALIAGGFGIGESSSNIRDIAAVVPHDDAREFPQLTHDQDIESSINVIKRKPASSSRSEIEPVIDTLTPFLHVDLTSAVRAAESGLRVVDSDSDNVELLKRV